jgi:hypothetical protein
MRCMSFFGGTKGEGSWAKINPVFLHLSELHIYCIKGGEALSFLESRGLGPVEKALFEVHTHEDGGFSSVWNSASFLAD